MLNSRQSDRWSNFFPKLFDVEFWPSDVPRRLGSLEVITLEWATFLMLRIYLEGAACPIPGSETETEHPFRGFRSVDHMPVTGQIDRRRYKLCASRKAPFAVKQLDFLIGHKQ